jgi:hypothetical protein
MCSGVGCRDDREQGDKRRTRRQEKDKETREGQGDKRRTRRQEKDKEIV